MTHLTTDATTIIANSIMITLIVVLPTTWFIHCTFHKMAHRKAEEGCKFDPFPLTMIFSLFTLIAFSISLPYAEIGSKILIVAFAMFSVFYRTTSNALESTDYKKSQTILNVMYSVAYLECLICMVHMLWVFF